MTVKVQVHVNSQGRGGGGGRCCPINVTEVLVVLLEVYICGLVPPGSCTAYGAKT